MRFLRPFIFALEVNEMDNAWRGAVPELPVADMGHALQHYREILGFSVQWVYEDFFASILRDDVRVFLRRQEPPFEEVVINFYVPNVDPVYEALSFSGARLLSAPEDKPWGTREFSFEDLDQNLFRVHQLLNG